MGKPLRKRLGRCKLFVAQLRTANGVRQDDHPAPHATVERRDRAGGTCHIEGDLAYDGLNTDMPHASDGDFLFVYLESPDYGIPLLHNDGP